MFSFSCQILTRQLKTLKPVMTWGQSGFILILFIWRLRSGRWVKNCITQKVFCIRSKHPIHALDKTYMSCQLDKTPKALLIKYFPNSISKIRGSNSCQLLFLTLPSLMFLLPYTKSSCLLGMLFWIQKHLSFCWLIRLFGGVVNFMILWD